MRVPPHSSCKVSSILTLDPKTLQENDGLVYMLKLHVKTKQDFSKLNPAVLKKDNISSK